MCASVFKYIIYCILRYENSVKSSFLHKTLNTGVIESFQSFCNLNILPYKGLIKSGLCRILCSIKVV